MEDLDDIINENAKLRGPTYNPKEDRERGIKYFNLQSNENKGPV